MLEQPVHCTFVINYFSRICETGQGRCHFGEGLPRLPARAVPGPGRGLRNPDQAPRGSCEPAFRPVVFSKVASSQRRILTHSWSPSFPSLPPGPDPPWRCCTSLRSEGALRVGVARPMTKQIVLLLFVTRLVFFSLLFCCSSLALAEQEELGGQHDLLHPAGGPQVRQREAPDGSEGGWGETSCANLMLLRRGQR